MQGNVYIAPHNSPDRFERALESARDTLRRARAQIQSSAIATEQKELFGHRGKSVRGSKGKKKARPCPWTKQFYCLAYCDQDRVPVTEDELDELAIPCRPGPEEDHHTRHECNDQ